MKMMKSLKIWPQVEGFSSVRKNLLGPVPYIYEYRLFLVYVYWAENKSVLEVVSEQLCSSSIAKLLVNTVRMVYFTPHIYGLSKRFPIGNIISYLPNTELEQSIMIVVSKSRQFELHEMIDPLMYVL